MRDQLIKFTKSLIQTRSENGNETKICKIIQEKLSEKNIKTELFGSNKDRQNLIATIGEPNLMFSGHIDTVPAGSPEKWNYPPFEAVQVGDKIFGRGARDMKGGVAALVFTALSLPKDANVCFVFTSGEETGMSGAKEVVQKIKPNACILADGNHEDIIIGCRGGIDIKITVKGEAGHTGSLTDDGKNAVLEMSKLLTHLDSFKPTYTKHPDFPPPKITPGVLIKGGVAHNIIPDSCEAWINCRLSLGQTPESIVSEIKNHISSLNIDYSIETNVKYPPYMLDKNHTLVTVMKKSVDSILSKNIPLKVTGGGNEAAIYSQKGIPTVTFGTEGKNYHKENEWVSIQSIINCVKIFTNAAEQLKNSI